MNDTTLHPTTPATITDKNGDVWAYQPSALEGKFARTYVMGKRTATLMAYANGGPRKLISVSGKLLAKVDESGAVLPEPVRSIPAHNPVTGSVCLPVRVGGGL